MFGTGGEGGDIFVVLGLVSRRGPFRTRGAIESSNILVQINRTTPDLIWSSISKTHLNLSWGGNLTWGLGWREILTFHSTFAFLKRKKVLVHKSLQWMVAIGRKWHPDKALWRISSTIFSSLVSSFTPFRKGLSRTRTSEMQMQTDVMNILYFYQVQVDNISLWSWMVGIFFVVLYLVVCTIQAWKYLLHTLDWRLRRKYLLYRIEMSTPTLKSRSRTGKT